MNYDQEDWWKLKKFLEQSKSSWIQYFKTSFPSRSRAWTIENIFTTIRNRLARPPAKISIKTSREETRRRSASERENLIYFRRDLIGFNWNTIFSAAHDIPRRRKDYESEFRERILR